MSKGKFVNRFPIFYPTILCPSSHTLALLHNFYKNKVYKDLVYLLFQSSEGGAEAWSEGGAELGIIILSQSLHI